MLMSIGGSTPRLGPLPRAFMAPDPMTGLEILVQVLMHLWESERLVLQPGGVEHSGPRLPATTRTATRRRRQRSRSCCCGFRLHRPTSTTNPTSLPR
jgi:hypothetical protein